METKYHDLRQMLQQQALDYDLRAKGALTEAKQLLRRSLSVQREIEELDQRERHDEA